MDGPTTWPRWRSNVERSLRGHAASLLATRFADLGLRAEGQLAKVIAFNVGIELGQATAIFAMFVIGVLVAEIVTQPRAAAERVPEAVPASDTGTASPAAAAPDILDGDSDDRSHRSPATPVLQRARAALFIGGSVAAALIGC